MSRLKIRACGTCGEDVRDWYVPYLEDGLSTVHFFHVPCEPGHLAMLADLLDGPNETWWLDQHQKLGRINSNKQRRAIERAARSIREELRGTVSWLLNRVEGRLPTPQIYHTRDLPRPIGSVDARCTSSSGRKSFAVRACGGLFKVRWLRRKPFLYQVLYKGAARSGRPRRSHIYLGRIDEAAALAGPEAVAALVEQRAWSRVPVPPVYDDGALESDG